MDSIYILDLSLFTNRILTVMKSLGKTSYNNITNAMAVNVTNGNIVTLTALTANASSINITNGNVTTLVAPNFSTANAQITGGNVTGINNVQATTANLVAQVLNVNKVTVPQGGTGASR